MRIALERGVTFLVGENNAGKSSFLLAVATGCGSRRGTRDDLLRTEESIAGEATIDVVLRSGGDAFDGIVAPRLVGNFGRGPGTGEWAAIRTRLRTSHESPQLVTRRSFLAWDEGLGEWTDTGRVPSQQVLELISSQFIEASRDLAGDLLRRSSNWGRVLTDLGVEDESRHNLENRLSELGLDLRDASPTLDALARQLSEMKNAQSGVEEVQIHPLPDHLEDLVHSIDVLVGGGGESAKLPMRMQGLGSRSLAALRVYFALCELRIGADKGIRPQLITLLEEPEAHLHPQAQAAVARSISDLPGQVLVATHSAVLVGEANLRALRLFRLTNTGVRAFSLTRNTAKQVAVFRRYISRPLGELLFARLVILVDGTAERNTLPVLLNAQLGRDISGLGIAVLDMQGPSNEWLQKVINALNEFGQLPWIAFVDNDSAGLNAIEGCLDCDGVSLSIRHPNVVMSGQKQLEQMLIDAGYHQEIEQIANEHAPWSPLDPLNRKGPRLPSFEPEHESQYLSFLAESKGWSGELIAREAVRNGRPIPQPIVELANRVDLELGIERSSDANASPL